MNHLTLFRLCFWNFFLSNKHFWIIFFKAPVGIYFYSQLFKNLSYDPPLTFPYLNRRNIAGEIEISFIEACEKSNLLPNTVIVFDFSQSIAQNKKRRIWMCLEFVFHAARSSVYLFYE